MGGKGNRIPREKPFSLDENGSGSVAMDTVELDKKGPVALITMRRPGALNALSRELRRDLEAALSEAEADPGVGAIVLTGEGKAFSVGQDVGELKALYDAEGEVLGRLVEEEYVPLLGTLERLTTPTIAAVNGVAAGGGMALALACDLRLATRRATFLPAFVSVGLVPDSGASFHLVRMLGLSKAMEITLLGEPLDVEAALRLGLVREVFESAEDCVAAALDLATRMASGPRSAYPAIKALLRLAASADFEEVVAMETETQERLGHTWDHREAVEAFLEKRAPRFEGH